MGSNEKFCFERCIELRGERQAGKAVVIIFIDLGFYLGNSLAVDKCNLVYSNRRFQNFLGSLS